MVRTFIVLFVVGNLSQKGVTIGSRSSSFPFHLVIAHKRTFIVPSFDLDTKFDCHTRKETTQSVCAVKFIIGE
jgi:hypothetical protein